MVGIFRRWRKQRAIGKVKPGDGHLLKSYRFWELFHRSLFYMKLRERDGVVHTYAVNVNYFSEDEKADLYRDGTHYATSKLPATFPVYNGFIEVGTSTYGLTRMHFVTGDTEHQLQPDSKSLEGLRMRLDIRYPQISTLIAWTAIIVLLVSLILGLPQLAALISQIPFISERFGSFESLIILPDGLNLALLIGGTLAALERALTLRNHWLIDMETWWDN